MYAYYNFNLKILIKFYNSKLSIDAQEFRFSLYFFLIFPSFINLGELGVSSINSWTEHF